LDEDETNSIKTNAKINTKPPSEQTKLAKQKISINENVVAAKPADLVPRVTFRVKKVK